MLAFNASLDRSAAAALRRSSTSAPTHSSGSVAEIRNTWSVLIRSSAETIGNSPSPDKAATTAASTVASTDSPTPADPKRTAAHKRNGRKGASGAFWRPMRPASCATANATRLTPPVIAATSSQRRSGHCSTPRLPVMMPATAGTIASCASTFDRNRIFHTVQYASPWIALTTPASRNVDARGATTPPKTTKTAMRRSVSNLDGVLTEIADDAGRDQRLAAVGEEDAGHEPGRPDGQLHREMRRCRAQQHAPPAAGRDEQQQRRQDGVRRPHHRRCRRRKPQLESDPGADVVGGARRDSNGHRTVRAGTSVESGRAGQAWNPFGQHSTLQQHVGPVKCDVVLS